MVLHHACLRAKKLPTAVYFPENTRVFSERRTNTLIILGTKDGIKKVEDFIVNYIDTELKLPYSPLYVYELQYTKAEDMATILNSATKFSPESAAAQSGGVRDGEKYLRPMFFQAEPSGNRLLINAEKEDYLKVVDVIKKLDVKQPQVAIEVLIVNVINADNCELGVQIRNKDAFTLGSSVNFQTSGFPDATNGGTVVLNQDGSLMGNLVNLAQSQTPGALLVSIANTANSVWAIFGSPYCNHRQPPMLLQTHFWLLRIIIKHKFQLVSLVHGKSGIVSGVSQTGEFNYVTQSNRTNKTSH